MERLTKKRAIELVKEFEKTQGRNPEDVNKFKQGFYIKSGDRLIDIKINGERESDLLLSFQNFKRLGTNIKHYYVYLLMTKEDKVKLKILEPNFVLKNFNLLTLMNVKASVVRNIPELDL